MASTPRQMRANRDVGARFGTLIGNGWLRESPRNGWPSRWDVRSKSALRKCMYLPVPDALMHLMPRVSPSALPAPRPAPRPIASIAAADVATHRNNPRMNVREMPAYVTDRRNTPRPARKADPSHGHKVARRASWWEDPVALGSLLILVPPIGLAALWSSKRYSTDARWALTIMTALTMCLVSAVAVTVLVMR